MEKKIKCVYLDVRNCKAPRTEEVNIENNKDFHRLICCDTIDIVRRMIGKNDYCIVVDDYGWLKQAPIVSAISRRGGYPLAGNLVITGLPDNFGELTSLTDEECKEIKENCWFIMNHKFPEGKHVLVFRE